MENFTQYTLIRSKRRTISVEVNSQLEVIVRAPYLKSQRAIDAFLLEHGEWIEKSIKKQRQRKEKRMPEPTEDEVKELKKAAKEYLPERTAYFAEIMGVTPSNIKITSAKKRLGSCTWDDRICFSYRVMMYPENVIDYVIIHELAHIKEHNHSKRFYSLVQTYCPDYRNIEKLIKG